jgi:hypothetical protein
MLLRIVAIATVLFPACGGSPTAPRAAGDRYTGSYSYQNQQSGPGISGTLSFELAQSDFSEIRNVQLVVNGCANANLQAESVLVPNQTGPPGRGPGWFTINLESGPPAGVGATITCGWHDDGSTTCGMVISTRSCGLFGESDKTKFPITKY